MYFASNTYSYAHEHVLEYKKFIMKDDNIVVKLDKALHGCIESAKLWYQHLKGAWIRI